MIDLKKYFFNFSLLSILFVFFLGTNTYAQYEIPAKPKSDLSLIFDYSNTNVLNPQEKQSLNQKLIDYERETSTQIAIVIVESLKGEDPNFLAAQWAHQWKIGQGDKDNGMIILFSPNDRKISIQNGYGLEAYMTDAKSRQIIDYHIIPYFKKGLYYEGLDSGTNAVFQVLDGTFVEEGTNEKEDLGLYPMLIMAIFMLIIFWIIGNNNRGGGGNGGRRGMYGPIIFSDMGRSSWSGGSGGGFSGGGGFGGFGGGGFGGGGASGSW